MKKRIRTVLNLLLILAFLFSIGMFARHQQEKAIGSSTYQEALALAVSGKPAGLQAQTPAEQETTAQPRWAVAPLEEEDPHFRELEKLDLEALREINPDVVGWIRIPDTVIDYPLMQGKDNDYYLNRTWDEQKNEVGSIFLEHVNRSDFTDYNTILYGHNMIDGSMFASLRRYQKQTYWEEHPYVYIRSDQGVYRYEIFSSYLADVESNTYSLGFPSQETTERFLDWLIGNSAICTGVTPEPTDRILTLSTCSGKGHTTRWVVHARLKMILEQPRL